MKKNLHIPPSFANEEGEEGEGGVTGEINFYFKDPLSAAPRDDNLSPAEVKRLLAVHQELHKARVDKQKRIRKERALQKEGPTTLTSRYTGGAALQAGGMSSGRASPYKKHPISDKFSGIDKQENPFPAENLSVTNEEQRDALEQQNELQNRHQLRHQPAPTFNPKLRPF